MHTEQSLQAIAIHSLIDIVLVDLVVLTLLILARVVLARVDLALFKKNLR